MVKGCQQDPDNDSVDANQRPLNGQEVSPADPPNRYYLALKQGKYHVTLAEHQEPGTIQTVEDCDPVISCHATKDRQGNQQGKPDGQPADGNGHSGGQ